MLLRVKHWINDPFGHKLQITLINVTTNVAYIHRVKWYLWGIACNKSRLQLQARCVAKDAYTNNFILDKSIQIEVTLFYV